MTNRRLTQWIAASSRNSSRLMERDPIAYEEAIGRLSPAELKAYGL